MSKDADLIKDVAYLHAEIIALQAIVVAMLAETLDDDPGERRLQVNRLLSAVDRTLVATSAAPGTGIGVKTTNAARQIALGLLRQLAGRPD